MRDHYRTSEALEAVLGTPLDPDRLLSFKRAVELDEQDAYPEAACDLLNRWGLARYYIPAAHGGKLRSFEEFLALLRVVARRDLTVAVAHAKTFLGTAPIWVAGTPEQQARLAAIIANDEQVALAYHEQAHGSDMAASEVTATPDGDGYRLDGEKWLVNNATRGSTITLFARTNPNGGPRGFSLFMVEKSALDPAAYSYLPPLRTHGIRGADFSGIRFENCAIPGSALIGPLGGGLELTLKAFQLTRTVIPGLALGAADTALRCALDFALGRKLYGDTVFAIPYAQEMLVDALLDLLVCDSVAIATTRAAHVATDHLRLWSSASKYFVPTTAETLIRKLGVVLGARHYLREGHQWGIFQKMLRDSGVVSVFHAGTYLNLITIQLQYLSGRTVALDESRRVAAAERLAAIFTLDAPLPAFDPARLALQHRGCDEIIQGVALARDDLAALQGAADVDPALLTTLLGLTDALIGAIGGQERLRAEGQARYGRAFEKSPAIFELTKRHCVLHAAACCLHMWRYNRTTLSPFLAEGEWLALCLDRLLRAAGVVSAPLPPSYSAHAAAELRRLYEADQLFSIVPLQLAQTDALAAVGEQESAPC